MDPLTHGLAGALIGKAFFGEPRSARNAAGFARVAITATVVGAMFPDIDLLTSLIRRDGFATLEWHRWVTHSLLCLPLFAMALAALTRWRLRRRGIAGPSWAALVLMCAAGLASHILLDLPTSYGTMIWSPLSDARVALDLVFILDFLFTGIVVLPQAAAWVYRTPVGWGRRAAQAWAASTLCAVAAWALAQAFGVIFSPVLLVAWSAGLAAFFFLPALGPAPDGAGRGWGFRVPQWRWCRAGVSALAAYLAVCAGAHQLALGKTRAFAASRAIAAEGVDALPMPPSPAHWAGLIRTADGVYEAQINLLSDGNPEFQLFADSPANRFTEAARQLPRVNTYLWFARYPVMRYIEHGDLRIVEFRDLRFFARGSSAPVPFRFRVTFDSSGRVIEQDWVRDLR